MCCFGLIPGGWAQVLEMTVQACFGQWFGISLEMCYITSVIYQDLSLECIDNISVVTICSVPAC